MSKTFHIVEDFFTVQSFIEDRRCILLEVIAKYIFLIILHSLTAFLTLSMAGWGGGGGSNSRVSNSLFSEGGESVR